MHVRMRVGEAKYPGVKEGRGSVNQRPAHKEGKRDTHVRVVARVVEAVERRDLEEGAHARETAHLARATLERAEEQARVDDVRAAVRGEVRELVLEPVDRGVERLEVPFGVSLLAREREGGECHTPHALDVLAVVVEHEKEGAGGRGAGELVVDELLDRGEAHILARAKQKVLRGNVSQHDTQRVAQRAEGARRGCP